ncbi:late embryogenesis abundant (LEA) protein-like protein [Actinidia rufa]|uniref:Late embryogenesis abundant (LEA) protein-like protein n=1 Tax=Actinidia rufa TaxID=165716 RepID=A0A7J0DNM7_9ERIC|nr:late embryogenesis abundant (LEA) protein-like protein [Actinidia rufa]
MSTEILPSARLSANVANQVAMTLEQRAWTLDLNLQINARFIGLRPEGRPQDYTWIQALGILFDSHSFSVDATKASTWDDDVDHMKFSYNGKELVIPEGYPSLWKSPENDLRVEGVLGQNYQPDFKNPAKLGVAMPVVGGEEKYRTTSLLSADCGSCMFSSVGVLNKDDSLVMDFGTLDCTGGASSGNGIVCRK